MKRLTKVAFGLTCAGWLIPVAPALADRVKLEDLPPAAQKTVERETRGATMRDIDKEKDKNGKPYYEVDYRRNGEKWEVKVSPTGNVIDRHKD